MLRDLMLGSDALSGQQTLPDGSIIGYDANTPDDMIAAVANPQPPMPEIQQQQIEQPKTPQRISDLLVSQRPQDFGDQQRFEEAYQFKQQMPEGQSYLRNNTTGAVRTLPSGQRQTSAAAPSNAFNDLIRFGQVNSIDPATIGRLIKYQSSVQAGMPSAKDLYTASFKYNKPIGEMLDYYGAAAAGQSAREKDRLGIEKQRAELAQIGAKPVAVYGADGKTPEFVSPKDAIGRKPYTASIAGQGEFTPEALRTIAEQYLAGDRQAAQGYARNASAKMAIANEINKVAAEKGMSGADIAAVMADYQGMTAGSRVLGGRTANIQLAAGEAAQMIPLALEASKNVARAGFLPFGKAQIMFDDQTNDPALREFAAANNALVNTYARAISPAGVPTVHDKEHARQVLSTAHDQKSYEATVLQMKKEMDAALAAPGKVREKMREGISGKTLASSTSSPVATDRGAVIEQNGVQYMVMSRNADGSAVIKDPKTGKTGVWRP